MINTRRVSRPDGGEEIVRILDGHLLHQWQRENPLAFEKSIVWLRPLETLDFVRVAMIRNAKSRRGPLLCSTDVTILGYSKLTGDTPFDPQTKAYTRRLFYLSSSDFELNMNQFPAGSLDPQTILPGATGSAPDLEKVERGYPWWRCRAGLPAGAPAFPPPSWRHRNAGFVRLDRKSLSESIGIDTSLIPNRALEIVPL